MLINKKAELRAEITLNGEKAGLLRTSEQPNKVAVCRGRAVIIIGLADLNPFVDSLRAMFAAEL